MNDRWADLAAALDATLDTPAARMDGSRGATRRQ